MRAVEDDLMGVDRGGWRCLAAAAVDPETGHVLSPRRNGLRAVADPEMGRAKTRNRATVAVNPETGHVSPPQAQWPSGSGGPRDRPRKETQPRHGGSGPRDGPRTVTPTHRPSGSGGAHAGGAPEQHAAGTRSGTGAPVERCASRRLFLRVPLEWLQCVCHLADNGVRRADGYRRLPSNALLQVSRGVRERVFELRRAAAANPRPFTVTLRGLHGRLRVYGICQTAALLSRLTPERLAAKRWHRLLDHMVLPRALVQLGSRGGVARVAWELCVALRGLQWALDAYQTRVRGPRRTRRAVRTFLCQVYRECGAPTLLRSDLARARVR